MNQSPHSPPMAKPPVRDAHPATPSADGRKTLGRRARRSVIAESDLPRATDPPASSRLVTTRDAAGFLISLAVHMALLILLSLWFGNLNGGPSPTLQITSPSDDGLPVVKPTQPGVLMAQAVSSPTNDTGVTGAESIELPSLNIDNIMSLNVPKARGPGPVVESPGHLMLPMLAPHGGGFQGRSGAKRGELVASGGGTPQSEDAVALGLAWLAAHQWPDGGWRFDLESGPCKGRCRDSGEHGTTTGATGLALLAFLGTGQTHLQGEYRDVIQRGLYYLRNHMRVTTHGGDLQEGTMYAQGIATIALCEAFGLSQDSSLQLPAQRAIDFICYAQHSKGGWRYLPQTPGDTTVFGWQMMALKSALLAGLEVPSPVIALAERYLDSVQTGDGSYYGYSAPGKRPTTTAVGLLIRMYTGWHHSDSRLARGVDYLAKEGPSRTDLYFDYYATQVLHHYGGRRWPKWNVKMRDHLIRMQAKGGHERGSWFFPDQHGDVGGRLYTTAMAVMILEVYYRHMPLYAQDAIENDL